MIDLGRPERTIDRERALDLIEGRRVLITGAGGSIGTELARQVAALNPAHLTLVNHSELALYEVDRALAGSGADRTTAAVDVANGALVACTFVDERPQLVFHAAAMKHVPYCEENPEAAVLTNIRGTRNVLRASERVGAEVVVISTDKAVHPACVMGATKRVAERLAFQSPRARVVRFGNVLGSSGSVIPLFERQIAAGGPVTITHPDVERYFMTIAEAVALVLAAATIDGRLFVLDMGAPIRIVDLALAMIARSGRSCPIAYTGLRPGEKLTEELFYPSEAPTLTPVDGVRRGVVDAVAVISPDLSHRRAVWFDAQAKILESFAEEGGRRDELVVRLRELVGPPSRGPRL